MKLVKACIALAAFGALFVVPSIASASPELTAPTGTTYTGNIIATNVAHSATGLATTMTVTESLRVECSKAMMTGKVLTNSGTHIEGEISAASFEGRPGATTTGDCFGGSLGDVQVTTNPTHNGLGSLPWCITANNLKDEFTVSGKCGTANPVVFELDFTSGFSCTYAKQSITGTYTTHPADATLTISGQEVPKVTGGIFCPNSGKLDMAFTLTEDLTGAKEGNPIYIS